MKRTLWILLALMVCTFAVSSWGVCPEEQYDHGECDTLHIEPWAPDLEYEGTKQPLFVRVPLFVTCDIDAADDSIRAFVIPLCYEKKTNVAAYCSVSGAWNNDYVYPFPDNLLANSVFRHFINPQDPGDTTIHNWMMDEAQRLLGTEWDTRIVTVDGTSSCMLAMFPTGSADRSFIAGYKILLATWTFKLEDTMTVCMDTCFQEPANRLSFIVERGGETKIPRSGTRSTENFEVCFSFGPPGDVREIPGSDDARPAEFSLSQNYPNPFNPYTNFRFTLAKSSHVKIDIFNIVGQRVKTLVDEEMKAGVYAADWDGKDDRGKSVSSGVYFYRMQAGDFSDMKKMLLVK